MTTAAQKSRSSGLGLATPHVAVGLLCAGLIGVGWMARSELDLSPAAGAGYGLGILGLASMTLLLGYSIRKRAKWLRSVGAMRNWFEVHLILGLIGPTAILYHSGFDLGSMNSTISLACVLAVSGSGIGGRFLYGRMHRSLAGPRRSAERFYAQSAKALEQIEDVLERAPHTKEELMRFCKAEAADAALPILAVRVTTLRLRSWRLKRKALQSIKTSSRPQYLPESARVSATQFFSEMRRGSELRLFEKLFALWHAIHIPLTIILFISAAIHVVAVHLY